jgi:hypothetical protein
VVGDDRDLGVVARVEEVGAVDDVLPELARAPDRDRLDRRRPLEPHLGVAGHEAGRELLEPGPEERDPHVPDGELDRRVRRVDDVGPDERARADRHDHPPQLECSPIRL